MTKLIIFDWDDVFSIGSKEGYFKCYQAVLDEAGVQLDPEEKKKRIMMHWGKPYHYTIRELLRERPELIEQGYEIYRKNLFGDTFVNCLHLFPSSRELLLKLHKTYTLAVASGVQPKLLKERIFPKFDIPDVFTEIITGHDLEDSSKAKPHPFIAQEIMRRTGMKQEESVMVGDAKNDVLMAQNAGIRPIVVLTGHLNREEAQALGVKDIIPDVTHIEEVL
ncbi:MAG: HAD family hydrolase [Candidatus Levyibacteriota bacterium]